MKYFFILILCFFSGCSFFSGPDLEQEKMERVQVFQDLLNQGWEIFSLNGKVILYKETSDGKILYNDVFGVLE